MTVMSTPDTKSTSLTCLNPETGLRPANMQNRLQITAVSHLIEDGVDPLFVQQQVGHSWASTTAIYTVCQKLHQMGDLNGFFRELVA